MIKSIVLDNGDVIDYVDDINNATPQFVGKNIIYELAGSYNPLDPYLTLKKFDYIERDVTDIIYYGPNIRNTGIFNANLLFLRKILLQLIFKTAGTLPRKNRLL